MLVRLCDDCKSVLVIIFGEDGTRMRWCPKCKKVYPYEAKQ